MTEQRHASLVLHPIEAGDGEAPVELLKRQQIIRRARIASVVCLILLALGAGRTVLLRQANARVLAASTEENAKLYVKTSQVRRASAGQTLALPGTLQGFVQAPISARASGYLVRWTRDIGSVVAKGELLAEIDAPEIDQQLSQAIGARDLAASSLALARSTQERWEGLHRKDVASQQELDEKRSGLAQAQANLVSAEANMQRLRQLESFKRVLAPFGGVITRRNVDVGDLIDGSRVLFALAQTDPLRVYVNVPQSYAHLVKPNQPVVVTQGELRGRQFPGKVARTSASIDAATRTMQIEVSLRNQDGTLLPGAYVQVALPLAAGRSLVAPTSTLIVRGAGTLVALLNAQGQVTLRKVSVGRNYGTEFEVLDGVSENDRLVVNPPDSLADGQTVSTAPATAAPSASPSASPAAATSPATSAAASTGNKDRP